MRESFINVSPIRNADQLKRLLAAAAEDNHYPVYPTHTILRGDEITGCLSVCAVPMLTAWCHTEKMGPRQTMVAINIAKNLAHMASNGNPVVAHCPTTSPVYPYISRMGFVLKGATNLFIEEVK